mgnify:CR=1 FL=1|tara:strand:+ start:988 stop:1143 length:156 start_codon:yes stop_codon:yes gene_type:complete
MRLWHFKIDGQTSLYALSVWLPEDFTTEDAVDHLTERYPDAEGLILVWPAD